MSKKTQAVQSVDDVNSKPEVDTAQTATSNITIAGFDPAAFRLPANGTEVFETETLDGPLQLRKPAKYEWFRTAPREESPWLAALIKADQSDEYVLLPNIVGHFPSASRVELRLVITRKNEVFVWPVRQLDGPRKPMPFITDALRAAEVAEKDWIRMEWNGSGYSIHTAKVDLPEPEWPADLTIESALTRMGDSLIDSLEHPVAEYLLTGK